MNFVYEPKWTPTPANINALPLEIRTYIHDLATICDPAGDIRTAHVVTENNLALIAKLQEAESRIAELEEAIRKAPCSTCLARHRSDNSICSNAWHVWT